MTQLLTALNARHLRQDERFDMPGLMWENRNLLGDAIESILKTRSSGEWMEIFDSMDIPVNLIATVEEKPLDPQILENDIAIRPTNPGIGVPLLLNHPIKVTSVPQVEPKRPPTPGEHAVEILKELGYDDEAIDAMRARGII
jgi:crotonobetainyl-CoA:carnitine CoA-transferase CaiB-like acyl-CoA transferase